MKRRDFLALSGAAAVALAMPSMAFGASEFSVKCVNGEFIGFKEAKTGVVSFKGIPFAKAPIGKLRWLPPQEVAASNEKFEAKDFGDFPLQNLSGLADFKDGAKDSEDCLKLNIWASDLKGKNRPVMFYIHGGSFSWGGSADLTYNGQFIVEQNPDIIVVTSEYRLNSMGFIDLSNVPGYNENYKHSTHLGLLDDIAALKWVKQNIAKFGGNPENITIFGESAGSISVSALMISKEAKGLFKRVIAQSGSFNGTFDKEKYKKYDQTSELMKATGAKNLDDLLALSGDEIKKAWLKDTNKVGIEGRSSIQNLQSFPLRGGASIIPTDPYKALEEGASKDIDLMVGTTADEWRFWILYTMDLEKCDEQTAMKFYYENTVLPKMQDFKNQISPENQKYLDLYFAASDSKDDKYNKKFKNIWKYTELISDLLFRMPAIKQASAHANAGGKVYMYYFGKESDANEWAGAPHAAELSYVFYNLADDGAGGTVDKILAKKIVTMWANFARSGNPSIDGFTWTPYDTKNRSTMVVGKKGELSMINDIKGEQRELLERTGVDLRFIF